MRILGKNRVAILDLVGYVDFFVNLVRKSILGFPGLGFREITVSGLNFTV